MYYSLWDLRGFVPSNYTRIYRSKIYNQAAIEPSCCNKIIIASDLKPLSGIWKLQVRELVLLKIQEEKESVDSELAQGRVSKLLHEVARDLGLNIL